MKWRAWLGLHPWNTQLDVTIQHEWDRAQALGVRMRGWHLLEIIRGPI